jgi:ubiquinone/menaquinone biosynthesis C-methylase UbiE
MDVFTKLMNLQGNETILDVGAGGGELWTHFSSLKDLRLIGLDRKKTASSVYREFMLGDARDLAQFGDCSIDIVFSNSVLEHVGNFQQQQRMADEVRRVGKKYFIQVPNKHFFIEPHYFIPFFQYLPLTLRKIITRYVFGETEEIHLPTKNQLRILFPDAEIIPEKWMGLSKSYYAVKR